ncbi:epoxyqueuosine reductase QueH [Hugonella massiliensis]|uniref:epoxyqueuosine reductase QueH n=1 Tax=Hugonella massiliensis TaxID=1720315 RepID=UPI00073E58BF|nr:epoxyqueuosine reductase QueH [Hugonella massiliensis]
MKTLLHACCGPCSLEPYKLLAAQGHDLTIAFMNSNIQPRAEYDHRLATLREWADASGIPVVEGVWDACAWRAEAGHITAEGGPREDRCRHCYRLRLTEAAAWAAAHGFEGLSTTLAVSPYQLFDICHEELVAACRPFGLVPVWQDFRPYYPEATRESRDLGMYRQNYCGCVYSKAEAEEERAARKRARAAERARREAELAPLRAAEEAARAQKKRERAAYDAKQRAKKAARKAARAQLKAQAAAAAGADGAAHAG